MSIPTILFCVGLFGLIALIAVAGRWAANGIDEANAGKHPAEDEKRAEKEYGPLK